MTSRRTPVTGVLIALVSSVFLLASCGTTEEAAAPGDRATPADKAAPVSVTDSRGKKVTLKDGPAERVIALEWSEVEDLVTLGVMPVGIADPKGFATWNAAVQLDDSVKDVGSRGEPSVDSIVALEPDVVIVEPDRGEALIRQLEEQVPVIVIEGSDASNNIAQMKGNFTLIAKAVGKEDKAATVVAEFDEALAAGRKKLAAAGVAGEGFAMADGWMEGSSVSIRMFGKGSLMSDIAEELGLENQWKAKVDPTWGLGQTDVEGLTGLKDVHFFYSASEDDVFAEGLADNAIWTSLPFVKDKQLYKLDDGTWTFGGPRSCISFIDQVVKALAP
ncbi:iron-siderophore ABC transporter substrate-binding protein [Actinopolymorpha sp. B17G11]|uniref:ABC transporter substrate-binding protein n=1 Tax=unclassified Actinopolymorpha TaxID=2627063 RepID=UPI0032D8E4DE